MTRKPDTTGKRNERTSAQVAKIAGSVLRALDLGRFIKEDDIRALAASALTQARDHAEHEAIRKGRLPEGHRVIRRHKAVARSGKVRAKG